MIKIEEIKNNKQKQKKKFMTFLLSFMLYLNVYIILT